MQLSTSAERPHASPASDEDEATVPEPVRRALARYSTVWHEGAPQMGSQDFAGLCKDCGLIDEKLASHVNLIFARVTRPGFVMDAAQLVTALALIAKRKGCPVSEVHAALAGVCDSTSEFALALGHCEELLNLSENERHLNLDSIEDRLTSGDAVLLKGRWLLELCDSRGVLPHRQDLSERAIWSPNLIMKMVKKEF